MNIDPSIFKAYDIRGIEDKNLSPEVAELIGKGFGTYLINAGTRDCIVGRDTRRSSKEYEARLIKGLLSTGVNVRHIGHCFVPTVYFARKHYGIDGGVMVTASHNPPEYNGFKLCHGQNTIYGEEIQKIRKIIDRGEFTQGEGKVTLLTEAVKTHFAAIKKRFGVLEKKLKVVVDCTNGTSALFIPDFLREIGCEVETINDTIDPNFPGHLPDPVFLEGYKGLVAKVKETKADLGVMVDTDVDRVGFVDNLGNIWMGDMILILLARYYLPNNPNSKVIVELKDSEAVIDEVKRLGSTPILWKTGHSFLDEKVAEEKAILCAEMSCHYWITKDWFYFDDATLCITDVIKIISESEKTFAELMAEIPFYPSTPEYRIAVPAEKQLQIVEEVVNFFKKICTRYLDTDGIRGYWGDGWFLFRSSNTQPLVSLRVEARTKEGLEKLKVIIKEKLDTIPDIKLDWNKQYE